MFRIYVVTCNPTGMQYVGQTKRSVRKRWKDHVASTLPFVREIGERGFCFAHVLAKYRPEDFSVKQVACARTLEDARYVEVQIIRQYRTQVPHGYNIACSRRIQEAMK